MSVEDLLKYLIWLGGVSVAIYLLHQKNKGHDNLLQSGRHEGSEPIYRIPLWYFVLMLTSVASKTIEDFRLENIVRLFGLRTTDVLGGIFLGGILGYIGGLLGAGLITHFSFQGAKVFDRKGRNVVTKDGIESSRWMGIFSGVMAGGLTAGFGQSVSPNFVLFSVLLISAFVSFTILRGLTEAIERLYGTIIGGAIAGAAAGYLSLLLLHSY